MNKETINRTLRPLGLEIQHGRGSGYSYFTSRRFGHQIWESVAVCYLSSITLPEWFELGRRRIKQHRREGFPFAYATITRCAQPLTRFHK
jgi:hypothetical protein